MSLIKRLEWPSMGGSLLSDFFDDERFFNSPSLRGRSLPAINVKENESNYQIEVAAPGFEKKDFNISMEQGVLTISGEKKEEKEEKDEKYTRREFGYSSFSRSFTLPQNVNEEDVKASFENGILKLAIKKKEGTDGKWRKSIQVQ